MSKPQSFENHARLFPPFHFFVLPVLLFNAVVGVCDQMLGELKATRRHPTPIADVAPKEFFRRMGAEEWDRIRTS